EKEINKIVKEINEREIVTAKKENRIPANFEKMYPHAIRHTFCSRCYQKGIDVKTTQKLMGHSSISITLDYYTHLGGMQYSDAVSRFGFMDD
nr:tyrosine-type recombinase/integrase [Lachnospiraceae bacterium]